MAGAHESRGERDRPVSNGLAPVVVLAFATSGARRAPLSQTSHIVSVETP